MKTSTSMKVFGIISAIFALIAGVLFIAHPVITGASAVWFIGIMVVASGISDIIMHFVVKEKESKPSILWGILKILLGAIAMRNVLTMELVLGCVFSIYVIMGGCRSIENSLAMKKAGIKGWVFVMILAIIIIIAGGSMLLFPISAVTTTAYVIGFAMIIEAIMSVISVIFLSKVEKEIKGE